MEKQTPVSSLQLAIGKFPTLAAFARALTAQAKRPPGSPPISRTHVENWIRRGTGVPAGIAPDVEAISGVRVELLRPDVSWHVIRGKAAPILRNVGRKTPAANDPRVNAVVSEEDRKQANS